MLLKTVLWKQTEADLEPGKAIPVVWEGPILLGRTETDSLCLGLGALSRTHWGS